MKTKEKMILQDISLRNFKCFKSEQTIDFKKLTVLTGANSSGKSSIIYGILGALQTSEFPFQFSPNGKYINMGDFKEISNKHLSRNTIEIGFTFYSSTDKKRHKISTIWKENTDNNLPELFSFQAQSDYYKLDIKKANKYFLNFSYIHDKNPQDLINKELFEELMSSMTKVIDKKIELDKGKNKNKNKLPIKTEEGEKKLKDFIDRFYSSHKIENLEFSDFEQLKKQTEGSSAGGRMGQVVATLIDIFSTFDQKTNFISSFRLHTERTYLERSKDKLKVSKFGDGYLDQVILWETKDEKKSKELVSVMKELNLLFDIQTHRIGGGRFEIAVRTKPHGLKVSLSDVGFGISQFLPIIVADLQLPENSTLVVSQPEIHLHPSVQAAYADFLCKQIDKNKKNYIIETHSEYFLNRLRLAIIKNQIKETDLAVYYLENQRNDVKVHNLIFNKKGEIKGAPDSFFKTYLMDIKDIALNAE